MKIKLHIWAICLMIFSVFLQSCSTKGIDQPIPDRDIIFQLDKYYYGSGEYRIGFLNADGTGEMYINTKQIPSVVKPVWTDQADYIIFSHPVNHLGIITKNKGRFTLTDYWTLDISPIHNKNQVLFVSAHNGKEAVKLLDLDSRNVRAVYTLGLFHVDEARDRIHLGLNNLHNNQLLYARWWIDDSEYIHQELGIFNTENSEYTILLAMNGDPETTPTILSPSFSPDGEWIAYTSDDGIYLIRSDGSDNHKIVKSAVNTITWSPRPCWSPDGRSIVYHRCLLNDVESCRNNVKDSGIFKYDIETGEEVLLLKGGVNPYWRWEK
jgi:hypothetical protein